MTYLNTTILVPGYGQCLVTEEVTVKSGKVRLTYALPKGKSGMIMAENLPTPTKFDPPCTMAALIDDHRRDNAARRAGLMTGWERAKIAR